MNCSMYTFMSILHTSFITLIAKHSRSTYASYMDLCVRESVILLRPMSGDECMLNDFVESEPEYAKFCGIELTVY